jgi:hypothetical protein
VRWGTDRRNVGCKEQIIHKLGETHVSNVIELLEKMGAKASFGLSPMENALIELDGATLDAEHRRALMGCDVQALNRLLDGRAKMFCMIIAPDGAEEQEIPAQQDDDTDGDGEPDEK